MRMLQSDQGVVLSAIVKPRKTFRQVNVLGWSRCSSGLSENLGLACLEDNDFFDGLARV
jgi:hypothetical protein